MQQPVARHELTPRVAPPKLLELHLELARHVVDTALLIAHAHVLSRDRELDIGPLVLCEGPPTLAQHADDGYVAEWRALADLLDGGRAVEYDHILDDALFAVELADAAAAAVLAGDAA
jgi:hypothetical protein